MRRKRRGQNQTEDERLERNGLPLFSRAAYVYDCPNGIGFVGMAYLMSLTRFPTIGFVFLLGFLNVQSNVAAQNKKNCVENGPLNFNGPFFL
ncbi:hypothetical protein NIBR502774_12640 [Rhizobium sp. NIBRBAC000502774]|nr:hypothetical protein NIBR502774_12640 [Rhizobium sp. NIBRBAC000502774]